VRDLEPSRVSSMIISGRNLILTTILLLAASSSARSQVVLGTPGHGQTVRILVLDFESRKADLSEAVSLGTKKELGLSSRYETLSVAEAVRPHPKIDVKKDLDCIRGRQLAVYVDIPFVVCAVVEEITGHGYTIDVTVADVRSGSMLVRNGLWAKTVEDAVKQIARRTMTFIDDDI